MWLIRLVINFLQNKSKSFCFYDIIMNKTDEHSMCQYVRCFWPKFLTSILAVITYLFVFYSYFDLRHTLIFFIVHGCLVHSIYLLLLGLNRTSRPVRKSGKSWNVRIPDFRFFSFPDSGPFNIEKNPKKISKFSKFFFQNFFFQNFFFIIFFVYLYGKLSKNISPDSVRSGRTCPANLGVGSCPVRKLIYPVRSSPNWSCNFFLEF